MNNKLLSLIKQLTAALQRLQEVLQLPKNDIIRDSAIQRFEFTYELAWKTLRAYLAEKGITDLYTPKDTIKNAFQAGLIENDPKWLEMIEARNLTSHIYNEAMAERTFALLPTFTPLIENLIKKFN